MLPPAEPHQVLPSRRGALLLCGLLVAVPACVDLSTTWQVNLAILYLLPLLLYAQTRQRRGLFGLALGLVALTYAGYFFKVWLQRGAAPAFLDHAVHHYRFFNRSLAAGTILLSALVLHLWLSIQATWRQLATETAPAPDESLFLQAMHSLDQFVAVVLALLATVAALTLDVLTPGEINAPILYVVPVTVLGMTGHRGWMWGAVPVLLGLSYAGFQYGPLPTVDESLRTVLIRNRWIAVAVIVAVAVVLQSFSRWTRTRGAASPRNSEQGT